MSCYATWSEGYYSSTETNNGDNKTIYRAKRVENLGLWSLNLKSCMGTDESTYAH